MRGGSVRGSVCKWYWSETIVVKSTKGCVRGPWTRPHYLLAQHYTTAEKPPPLFSRASDKNHFYCPHPSHHYPLFCCIRLFTWCMWLLRVDASRLQVPLLSLHKNNRVTLYPVAPSPLTNVTTYPWKGKTLGQIMMYFFVCNSFTVYLLPQRRKM